MNKECPDCGHTHCLGGLDCLASVIGERRMGMFDTVAFRCPKCYEPVEVQSKAGRCSFDHHESTRVPVEIAKDINGTTFKCTGCNAVLEIFNYAPIEYAAMGVTEI